MTDVAAPDGLLAPARAQPAAASTVRSVERCIDILDILARDRAGMNLSALSRAIATPKSTTLTIVRTLVARGLVALDAGTKQYSLGLGVSRYFLPDARKVDLIDVAAPALEALARETRETATLALREADKVYNVCRFVGQQPLQLVVPIGIARELHATAGGKVFLAWMTDAERAERLAGKALPRFTPRTVTDPAALQRRLAAVRRNGYAIARGETSPELFGVAAPVLDRHGAVMAAVNLSGPLFRLAPSQERYVDAVRSAAAAISRAVASVGGELSLPRVVPAAEHI